MDAMHQLHELHLHERATEKIRLTATHASELDGVQETLSANAEAEVKLRAEMAEMEEAHVKALSAAVEKSMRDKSADEVAQLESVVSRAVASRMETAEELQTEQAACAELREQHRSLSRAMDAAEAAATEKLRALETESAAATAALSEQHAADAALASAAEKQRSMEEVEALEALHKSVLEAQAAAHSSELKVAAEESAREVASLSSQLRDSQGMAAAAHEQVRVYHPFACPALA